jgi:subtilisin family serine protease
MRFRVSTLISFGFGAVAMATSMIVGGCAQASRPGLANATPVLAESSTLYSLASSSARSTTIYESPTVSFALDRIDQRDLPLDQTYRHTATGKGVTVYVFDGGVSATHPELAGRVRTGYSAFPDDPKVCNPHGTAVAGAIAGSSLGVAPEAEIVDVKMVQCAKLRGTIKAIVDGARWVINELRAAGIPVIVSAGNIDIDACRVSPGNALGAIVVGASAVGSEQLADGTVRAIDRRSPGTAYGPCVDLYAPGDSVLLPSLDHENAPISQLWNGTSMSAGYVSGAVALFLEKHPSATPDEVAVELKRNATTGVIRDTHTPASRMLYVGTRDPRLLAKAAPRR